MEQRKNNTPTPEKRNTGTAQLRMDGTEDTAGEVTIEGYAFLFNSRTDMGWYDEIILPGALTQSELNTMDVRACVNHDPNRVMARWNRGKGNLHLEVDDRGLKYRYQVKESVHPAFVDNVRSGTISQSSFAFYIDEENWKEKEGENELREIVRFKNILDVAPVTYPAYEDTTVALRSRDKLREDRDKEAETIKIELQRRKRFLQLYEDPIL